jgi:hypothetical protein
VSKIVDEDEVKKIRDYYEAELKKKEQRIEELKRDNAILLRTALRQAHKKLVEEELKKAKKGK